MIYQGICHCGGVAFEVEADEEVAVEACNCSMNKTLPGWRTKAADSGFSFQMQSI